MSSSYHPAAEGATTSRLREWVAYTHHDDEDSPNPTTFEMREEAEEYVREWYEDYLGNTGEAPEEQGYVARIVSQIDGVRGAVPEDRDDQFDYWVTGYTVRRVDEPSQPDAGASRPVLAWTTTEDPASGAVIHTANAGHLRLRITEWPGSPGSTRSAEVRVAGSGTSVQVFGEFAARSADDLRLMLEEKAKALLADALAAFGGDL